MSARVAGQDPGEMEVRWRGGFVAVSVLDAIAQAVAVLPGDEADDILASLADSMMRNGGSIRSLKDVPARIRKLLQL